MIQLLQAHLFAHHDRLTTLMQQQDAAQLASKIWQADATLWPASDEPNRLGWLKLPEQLTTLWSHLQHELVKIKAQFAYTHVVWLGMGGSSMAAEVLQRTFPHNIPMLVLDSTHPTTISQLTKSLPLATTLFVVASKSGSTIETISAMHYFWHELSKINQQPERHFISVTDADTALEKLAKQRKFLAHFTSPTDVGGRYSVLSVFGLLAAALLEIPVLQWQQALTATLPSLQNPLTAQNPSLHLGACLAGMALAGRDKMVCLTSSRLAALPLWIEQLVAESSGKQSKGILPVVIDHDLGRYFTAKKSYQDHWVVLLKLRDELETTEMSRALTAAKRLEVPVVVYELESLADLAAEFLRWQLAVALACHWLRVNAFDQPHVELAKQKARELTQKPQAISNSTSLQGLASSWHKANGYLAILSYLHPTTLVQRQLYGFVSKLRAQGCTVILQQGPRYLHSTGQLFKGDAGRGVFLFLLENDLPALAIAPQHGDFATLIRAQAQGDQIALTQLGRTSLSCTLEQLDNRLRD